jgi:hypothetical protein
MTSNCATCRFFTDRWTRGLGIESEEVGNCARRAPIPVPYRQTREELRNFGGGSLWPVVLSMNWCGEHEVTNNVDIPQAPA